MGKGNLFTGILAGVALTLAGRYLLNNTETGKEVKKKIKEEVDKLRDQMGGNSQPSTEESTTETGESC